MKIGVLSDTRLPTVPSGGHGLGRMAWDMAAGLAKRGHAVTLFGGTGTAIPDPLDFLVVNHHDDETNRAKDFALDGLDAAIDLSHFHDVSRLHPEWAVVNWIVDTECKYVPPRCIVGNTWQQKAYPAARIVPLGIDVDAIPFVARPDGRLGRYAATETYLAFCHKLHYAKGVDLAIQIGERAKLPVHFAGTNFGTGAPEHYHGEITSDDALYEFIGLATALLTPAREDSGGRVNLEAAACGTPVIALDWSGAACHVAHCVSGFVCRDVDEMVEAVADVGLLKRSVAREWVKATHDIGKMIDGVEAALTAARDGEVW